MKKTNKKPVLSFIVKESQWRCGDRQTDNEYGLGKGDTALLNHENFKCCLGFACRAAGYRGQMTNYGSPEDTEKSLRGLTKKVSGDVIVNTEFSNKAMSINDNEKTSIEEKKKALIELGKRYNIKVKFVK